MLIRADASSRIGAGHVMRCLALAQAWQDVGGRAFAAMAMESPAAVERLAAEGVEVHKVSAEAGSMRDAAETARLAARLGAGWVVVDGYHFAADYQEALRGTDTRLMVLDDFAHAKHYWADIVLNQNPNASAAMYAARQPDTELLLGLRYVLLRREFLAARPVPRPVPAVARNLLVTMGGGDPDNVTGKVVEALGMLGPANMEAAVMISGQNPRAEQIQDAARRCGFPVDVRSGLAELAGPMSAADMIVSGGGGTCWESAYLGLPGLVIILADNQRPVAEALQSAGARQSLGWHADVTPRQIAGALSALASERSRRQEMSDRGRGLVDGKGSARVVDRMLSFALRLRPVVEDDCRLLWQWANDPEVRAVSFRSDPIPWEDHVRWFKARLSDSSSMMLIGHLPDGTAAGLVRFDRHGDEATISVSLDKAFRGRGYGHRLIALGSRKLLSSGGAMRILAYVKPTNAVSLKAFQRAGFEPQGSRTIAGQPAELLVMSKEVTP